MASAQQVSYSDYDVDDLLDHDSNVESIWINTKYFGIMAHIM